MPKVRTHQGIGEHVTLYQDQEAVKPLRVTSLQVQDILAHQNNVNIMVALDCRYRGST
jgi:hypothetical protein